MTKNKAEKARDKFWQIVGSPIEEKALKAGRKELDVFYDIEKIVGLLHKAGCSVSDLVLPEHLKAEDLEGIEKRISLADLEKLRVAVIELQGQE